MREPATRPFLIQSLPTGLMSFVNTLAGTESAWKLTARSSPYLPVSVEGSGRPQCTIIGGANGSGKSTIYDRLALFGNSSTLIIARGLSPERPEAASMLAGKRTLAELERALESSEHFVYETTLSSRQSVELMRVAGLRGYEVGLIFVTLSNADLNVQRVAERVAEAGTRLRRRSSDAAMRNPWFDCRMPSALRTEACCLTIAWHLAHACSCAFRVPASRKSFR